MEDFPSKVRCALILRVSRVVVMKEINDWGNLHTTTTIAAHCYGYSTFIFHCVMMNDCAM